MGESKNLKTNVIYEDGFFMGEKEIKIYYRSYEVEDSKSVIVICHGMCESSEKYRELIKHSGFIYFSMTFSNRRYYGSFSTVVYRKSVAIHFSRSSYFYHFNVPYFGTERRAACSISA